MSSTNDSSISVCAACGKADENLKACTACRLVKYCNRECQIAHRSKHKKECRKRAAELKHTGDNNTPNRNVNEISEGISNASISDTSTNAGDERVSTSYEQNYNGNSNVDTETTNEDLGRAISDDELFKDPPPKADCPICMLPMPYGQCCGVESTYMPCCGKLFCYGCAIAESQEMDEGNIKRLCSFCREPINISHNKELMQYKKRMKLNDSEAFYELGIQYREGGIGLPQDNRKAFELWKQGAELGSITAHYCLGIVYRTGRGVGIDMEKSIQHYKLAAIGGHEVARHALGMIEYLQGNMNRAMKHYMIAAKSGHDDALKCVGIGYKRGLVTKDDYASTLRKHQSIRNEMKSDQRTKAAEYEHARVL